VEKSDDIGDLSWKNCYNQAPGFRLGLVELIEQNRKRSRATLRILRLKFGQKRPEDGMHNGTLFPDSPEEKTGDFS